MNPVKHAPATPLPCPFCGGTNITVSEGSTFRWRVIRCACGAQCGEIRVQTLGYGTPEEWEAQARKEAIEAWNIRATLERNPDA